MMNAWKQHSSRTRDLQVGFPGGSDNKESAYNAGDLGSILGREGMATHSSILAWRVPWTEEPGRLQSVESQSRTRLRD